MDAGATVFLGEPRDGSPSLVHDALYLLAYVHRSWILGLKLGVCYDLRSCGEPGLDGTKKRGCSSPSLAPYIQALALPSQ